jgi:hypothetical protein
VGNPTVWLVLGRYNNDSPSLRSARQDEDRPVVLLRLTSVSHSRWRNMTVNLGWGWGVRGGGWDGRSRSSATNHLWGRRQEDGARRGGRQFVLLLRGRNSQNSSVLWRLAGSGWPLVLLVTLGWSRAKGLGSEAGGMWKVCVGRGEKLSVWVSFVFGEQHFDGGEGRLSILHYTVYTDPAGTSQNAVFLHWKGLYGNKCCLWYALHNTRSAQVCWAFGAKRGGT